MTKATTRTRTTNEIGVDALGKLTFRNWTVEHDYTSFDPAVLEAATRAVGTLTPGERERVTGTHDESPSFWRALDIICPSGPPSDDDFLTAAIIFLMYAAGGVLD